MDLAGGEGGVGLHKILRLLVVGGVGDVADGRVVLREGSGFGGEAV